MCQPAWIKLKLRFPARTRVAVQFKISSQPLSRGTSDGIEPLSVRNVRLVPLPLKLTILKFVHLLSTDTKGI